jgi:hypothetical protein
MRSTTFCNYLGNAVIAMVISVERFIQDGGK